MKKILPELLGIVLSLVTKKKITAKKGNGQVKETPVFDVSTTAENVSNGALIYLGIEQLEVNPTAGYILIVLGALPIVIAQLKQKGVL